MKILHIASFNGNIGDNANHSGFYKSLKEFLITDINVTQLEIRYFYKSWGLKFFDEEFAIEANKYDLVVFGGGNFFELWLEDSETGTTIDISKDILNLIKTPILFNCIGVDIYKGYSEKTKNKFKCFLEYLLDSENKKRFFVSVRNDGSNEILVDLYGKKLAEKIIIAPDPAFYFKPQKIENYPEIINSNKSIAINVAKDMLDKRFALDVTYDEFTTALAKILNRFLDNNSEYQIIFMPHIYSDLGAINDVLTKINDIHRRYNIKCAPYLSGTHSADYIFGLYAKCELVLGMRFHSNVCSIAQNIPTVGLINYEKHAKLYEEIGMNDRIIYVNRHGVERFLEKKIYESIKNLENIKQKYNEVNGEINKLKINYFRNIINWLKDR
ncbi:polysaccharide pyruvyl transferase family protein [Clostridium beijerinckii]|uniref:polysaccharide pyruvyl transferase family protein n=1 Tax=Clostridium beijerinckii TaxID=1520 RepID=UPI000A589A61|nr:polysaccharide pyruvyl transferase family protein [Clostridium beijerinckii]